MPFESGRAKTGGRKSGTRNKRSIIGNDLHHDALTKLTEAVQQGESWAIQSVLDRTMPKLKSTAIGVEQDLLIAQTELVMFKTRELSEFEQRLTELEQANT